VRSSLLSDNTWPIDDDICDPLFESSPPQDPKLDHLELAAASTTAAFGRRAELDDDDYDDDDDNEPLFAPPKSGSGSARHSAIMTSSQPININSSRWPASTPSPRNQTSTLTSALQGAGGVTTLTQPGSVDFGVSSGVQDGGRGDIAMMGSSYLGSGAQPISMQNRTRRESNTGSFINGMSWGPGSLPSGSWVNE
jgi:hypothetical protein